MGKFNTFVAVQVTDEGERDYEFPECLLIIVFIFCGIALINCEGIHYITYQWFACVWPFSVETAYFCLLKKYKLK